MPGPDQIDGEDLEQREAVDVECSLAQGKQTKSSVQIDAVMQQAATLEQHFVLEAERHELWAEVEDDDICWTAVPTVECQTART